HRVWGNLAVAYSRTPGQQSQTNDAYRRAAELCNVILKANPNDAHTLSNLASYEAFTGERADPLEKIQQALALAPKDSAVLYNAAETYEYLGFREQALLWLGKLLDLGYPVPGDAEQKTPPSKRICPPTPDPPRSCRSGKTSVVPPQEPTSVRRRERVCCRIP
ncbi:MAG: hypothetical protein EBY17_18180, partial [Acidobacteriia bacterium]|nr:hypothetical protein [Terriglobia bacterium]